MLNLTRNELGVAVVSTLFLSMFTLLNFTVTRDPNSLVEYGVVIDGELVEMRVIGEGEDGWVAVHGNTENKGALGRLRRTSEGAVELDWLTVIEKAN